MEYHDLNILVYMFYKIYFVYFLRKFDILVVFIFILCIWILVYRNFFLKHCILHKYIMQSVDVQNYQCILHKYIIQTVDVQNYQCILHKYIMQSVDIQNYQCILHKYIM
jgi:hypothetical protein